MSNGEQDYRFEYEQAPYAHIVTASFPPDRWSAIYYSWLSLKGYMLGVHGIDNTRCYADETDGHVDAVFVTIMSDRQAALAWLEQGYPVEEMLAAEGVAVDDIKTVLARDLS